MHLIYDKEPLRSIDKNHREFSDDLLVWQLQTLPLGNGYFGAAVYGYTDEDTVQITENSFANPYARPEGIPGRCRAGVISFCNLDFSFPVGGHTDYKRELSLDEGVLRIGYTSGGVRYKREYFASHPDRILAIRLWCEGGELTFKTGLSIPYLDDYCIVPGDGMGKRGRVYTEDGCVVAESTLDYYGVIGQGRLAVTAEGGSIEYGADSVTVRSAREAVLYFTVDTNYRMESRVFTEPDPKKKLAPYPHPEQRVRSVIKASGELGYDALLKRHIADYRRLYSGVELKLGQKDESVTTDRLVELTKEGVLHPELITTLFQFGRYLMIASSRTHLPANLQGIWSGFRSSPWSAGYWHNINQQMNYWAAFPTDLAECFLPYSDYNREYMPLTRKLADEYITKNYPTRAGKEGENGWIIGTGAWPYTVGAPGGHSGPGTGAFTSLLFWDHYEFIHDEDYLRERAYPVLREMSLFFSKTLVKVGDEYLVEHSASPEQYGKDGSYYSTVGCAFDQQMVWENYKRTLQAADILGIEEPLLDVIREQIDHLSPAIIGESGQIKEFREEKFYGDIGEYAHRHVSHLVGLYPGTLITAETCELAKAAEYSLTERGLGSSGWSFMHRLLMWARLHRGDMCERILNKFFPQCIPENLWDQHPPFQIDGNFGYTAGVCEMLMQSQGEYIELLPALPEGWSEGEFRGLVARGNHKVDCRWRDGNPTEACILSRAGAPLSLKAAGLDKALITLNGKVIDCVGDVLSLETSAEDLVKIVF